jgi:hypothetical protein
MAETVEDIANMALDLLVEAPITSLDDNDKPARLLKRHFDLTRRSELTKHAWAFAIFREELDALEDAPTSDVYGYGYDMPDDALRVLPLTYDGEVTGTPIPFKLEGRMILTNHSGPRLVRYIANLTDPADWDALFTEALAARLAMKIALPLTQKPTFFQVAQRAYEEAIADARRINAIVKGSVTTAIPYSEARGDYAGGASRFR